jgi:hypothetical protein
LWEGEKLKIIFCGQSEGENLIKIVHRHGSATMSCHNLIFVVIALMLCGFRFSHAAPGGEFLKINSHFKFSAVLFSIYSIFFIKFYRKGN